MAMRCDLRDEMGHLDRAEYYEAEASCALWQEDREKLLYIAHELRKHAEATRRHAVALFAPRRPCSLAGRPAPSSADG